MKIDVQEIGPDDYLLVLAGIGTMPSCEVDNYCERCLESLKEIFGCPIAILPVRDGEPWEMVLLRNPNRKEFLKKQEEKVKKVA